MVEPAARAFAYAVLRVVPRVERGERLNVGVVLFCRQLDFLAMRTLVDSGRIGVFAPQLDLDAVRERLEVMSAVAAADPGAGALARLDASDRFGWLTAPASTVIQPSAVHTGVTADPAATLERLFASLVG